MSSYIRTRVIWIDRENAILDAAAFSERGLSLELHQSLDGIPDLERARAVVLKLQKGRRGELIRWIADEVSNLLNHGVCVHIVTDTLDDLKFMNFSLAKTPFARTCQVSLNPKPWFLAEQMTPRNEPLREASADVTFDGCEIEDELFKVFLRRAFNDCGRLVIGSLEGGRTASVKSVHAIFRDSRVGPRPLPFFAKFGDIDKIQKESENYQEFVTHFVPFNLRPNLDWRRCLFGPTKGILVGDFVNRSDSLREALRRGVGSQPIHGLFEETMAGWRAQAYEGVDGGIYKDNFSADLRWFFLPELVTPQRLEQCYALGATKTPSKLKAALDALPPLPHRKAPMHGDLHCENVRVRGMDSILIDFANVMVGPLVVDPACLEVSVLFTEAGDSNEGWQSLINTLYLDETLERAPPPALEPSPREWLWAAVRQIRLIGLGCQTSSTEYKRAIIHCLLRRARMNDESKEDNERGAYAYVIAERLLGGV